MSRKYAAAHAIPNEMQARAALRGLPLAADSSRVNRTHRVVRERALAMQESRRQGRSLWLPLTIASAMLVIICYAVWTSIAQWDMVDGLTQSLPDGGQILLLSLWFLPVTATVLLFAWLRRNRNRNEDI